MFNAHYQHLFGYYIYPHLSAGWASAREMIEAVAYLMWTVVGCSEY
jgi:hypothetical protein